MVTVRYVEVENTCRGLTLTERTQDGRRKETGSKVNDTKRMKIRDSTFSQLQVDDESLK